MADIKSIRKVNLDLYFSATSFATLVKHNLLEIRKHATFFFVKKNCEFETTIKEDFPFYLTQFIYTWL